jgi:hypothetical protein
MRFGKKSNHHHLPKKPFNLTLSRHVLRIDYVWGIMVQLMKLKIILFFTVLVLASCSSSSTVVNERPIDYSNIDSVKTAINGNWYVMEGGEKVRLLVVNFDEHYIDRWNIFEGDYIEEIERTGELPGRTCPTGSSLTITNDSIFIHLSGLFSNGKIAVDSLSRSVLILDGVEYVRD